jgi:hypothetical protein
MLIQWNGVGQRVAFDATWQDGSVAEVDSGVAGELLSQPDERFIVAAEDPLAKIAGDHASALALFCSVFTVADLAALDEEGVDRVSRSTGAPHDTVMKWAEMAREA